MTLIAIIMGIIFTLFVPGYLIVETFFAKLSSILKIPLYIFLSLLVSTFGVYLASLIFGYGKLTILFTFLIFALLLVIFEMKKGFKFNFPRKHKNIFILASVTFLLFFICLRAGFFTEYNGYIVMSAENWQDTAMHMGITETISQGNFPPQAPYFSGQDLTYYYFIDFHAAIIETLSGEFIPQIFVYLNPVFIFLFLISIYSLSFTLTKNKTISFFSSILAGFYGNFMFIYYIGDILRGGDTFQLLVNKGYNGDFFGIMNVTTMADYFLQNRPMMIGLPAFAIILNLIFVGYKSKNTKLFLLVGIISSLMIKFQLFVTLAVLVVLGVLILFLIAKRKRIFFKYGAMFTLGLLPGLVLIAFLKAGNSSLSDLINKIFEYEVLHFDKDVVWRLRFLIQNFGFQIGLFLVTIVLVLLRKVKINKSIFLLCLFGITLFVVPYIVRFTIYDFDMMKFFYLAIIPISIVGSITLGKTWSKSKTAKFIVIFILFFASLTSLLNLGWSYFNKNMAYTFAEKDAGIWIRNNTPSKTVFIQMPVVHSAITEIGGRVRVLSYITWPYSHGFNEGEDNVFSRLDDIKNFYNNPNLETLRKYNVNYVYLGLEEINTNPNARGLLNKSKFLKKVYEKKDIVIYQTNI